MRAPHFPTDLLSIEARLEALDPVGYGETRNYTDGAVSYLSPYISRGVITGKRILNEVFLMGYDPGQIEKFIQELAWREYYQRIWQIKGSAITDDFPTAQSHVLHHQIPDAVANAHTGIDALDHAINQLRECGYMHNHCRMYLASMACNLAGAHWKMPAQWMYYHLLDADLASNSMSWKWVAGICNGKKYYANQENINRFTRTPQTGTFLDVSYDVLPGMNVPDVLLPHSLPELKTVLPDSTLVTTDPEKPTLIYTFYNLDPFWHRGENANRILLLEPSFFRENPVSDRTIRFILQLSENITGIQIFSGEWIDLMSIFPIGEVRYKEHPAFPHFSGIEESRDWMFPEVTGYYPSFFNYWKRCQKFLFQ